jgi:hypothetical protein
MTQNIVKSCTIYLKKKKYEPEIELSSLCFVTVCEKDYLLQGKALNFYRVFVFENTRPS